MQAIEKFDASLNWVTIVFISLLLGVFLIKGIDSTRLKRCFYAFFNKSYIVSEIEERIAIINMFSTVIFLYTVLTYSLLYFFILNYFTNNLFLTINIFVFIFIFKLTYFSVKWSLEHLIAALFSISKTVNFFLTAKKIYTHCISLLLFILLAMFHYTIISKKIILLLIGFLFVLKLVLLILGNKKLILNKLFYFILYLCAFEIAPLFILFELIF